MGKSNSQLKMYYDSQRRSCIFVGESNGVVEFIPLNILGFDIETSSAESFHHRFKEVPDYPIDRGCQLYLNYCLAAGASQAVLDALARVITISQEDYNMATTKKAATSAKKPAAKKATSAKKPAAKKATSAKKPAAKKANGPSEYTSAAQMFQGLIMAGQLSDDDIFAQVQAQFGLDDKKRSYVAWYRNHLRKKGENPPEPV